MMHRLFMMHRLLNLTIAAMFSLLPMLCAAQHYSTKFETIENPLYDSGKWVNGGSCGDTSQCPGLDWANVQVGTTGGVNYAYGTQVYNNTANDSTAVLTGTWGTEQTAVAVVKKINGGPEVELRLRTTIAAHSITGYELLFGPGYCEIVKWLGPLSSYKELVRLGAPWGTNCPYPAGNNAGVSSGDSVKGIITSNANGSATITMYVQSSGSGTFTQILTTTDSSPYTSGSIGMGFFDTAAPKTDTYIGFSSFTADASSPSSGKVAAPTGLKAIVQ